MKGEEAVIEMFQIIEKNKMLPDRIEDLVPISFIGQAAVSFYRNKLKAIDQLKIAEEQRVATLRDGQEASEMLLDIEARIGELLPSREESLKMGGKRGGIQARRRTGRLESPSPLPEGITHHHASQARKIAENPDVVERVKQEAREKEDIASKTAVLNAISSEKVKIRGKEISKEQEIYGSNLPPEEAHFLTVLIGFNMELGKMPRDWSKEGFTEAIGQVYGISEKLKLFTESKEYKEKTMKRNPIKEIGGRSSGEK